MEVIDISKCNNCKKSPAQLTTKLKQCAKCIYTRYCSTECQKADWKKHKRICGSPFVKLVNQYGLDPTSKAADARCMIASYPEKWFRGTPIDDRDKALLSAPSVSFIDYTPRSFLRKLTNWNVEADGDCKRKIFEGGATEVGFNFGERVELSYNLMTINVSIQGARGAGFDWGFLSNSGKDARLFGGPPETCHDHPWDALILRDCNTNTDTLNRIHSIASRKWDVLLLKMCEDYDCEATKKLEP
ncbi:hypothetical protein LTR51_001566 [Lithohypha guttulata]|nr:hypothetical protein LTR51_001566 [Lithohypha guttulata]